MLRESSQNDAKKAIEIVCHTIIRWFLPLIVERSKICLVLAFVTLHLGAVESGASFGSDGIDRSDPNFVTASLLVMSPGDELYSCAGHSVLRLECPKFNLDYCFTYESESVKDRVFTFLMGKLKMGMFTLPIAEYLKTAKEEGRGVMQYRLNLPPDVKQRLWKILDERAAQGANLPYDYVKRGCGRSVRVVLQEALRPLQMEIPSMPDIYSKTRRELWDAAVLHHPWNRFFLHSFCGTEHDWNVSDIEKIVVPNDLFLFLKSAKVNGKPIIDSEGVELVAPKKVVETSVLQKLFTPFVTSCVVVALAIVNGFVKASWIDWAFLAFQSLAGVFFTYLVVFSNLPATDWNWLIVPFNLLPLVFWHWRQKWALLFAGVLVLWEAGIIFYPHRLTDPAYLVLVSAYIVMYARIGWHGRDALCRVRIKETI